MIGLRQLSFRRKLVLLMMLTGVVVVVITLVASLGYEWLRYRQGMVRELSTEAAMIGVNSAAALAFDDGRAGTEVLGALRVRPEIVQAWLHRPGGELLAQYAVGKPSAAPVPPAEDGHWFEGRYLWLCQTVRLGDAVVGRICLQADLRKFRLRLWSYTFIVGAVMMVALGAALWVSAYLQRVVSEPVMRLTRAVRAVAEQKDYGLRVTKDSDDEVGVLIDGFNAMLGQIQRRDEELRASGERFRQVTETIQEVFWLRDNDTGQVVYVSPAYEQIWGRSCAELYLAPATWLEAVHPDDRARVRQAAMQDQLAGRYDEEYRIVRPDGTQRWVRDRAFLVRDDGGRIHRVAGLAQDITVRKRLERELLDISEREQRRIGQDLHDGLCQQLVGISFLSRLLEQKLVASASAHVLDAREIGELLHQAVIEARNLSHGLSPVRLEQEGLASALQELAGNITNLFHVRCEFECPLPVRVATNTVATHLYRIAQEGVNNAVKHGRPSQITLRLAQEDGALRLAVEDDGVGFTAEETEGNGIGLHVMRYRARMIGATLAIGRGPQGGTVLSCVCPQVE